MGTKNMKLWAAQARAREDGDAEEYHRLTALVAESQAVCPHPGNRTMVQKLAGEHWQICKWCSKPLQTISPMAEAALTAETRVQSATSIQPSIFEEINSLAQDLDDEWQCSGGVRHWNDEEKHSFIKRGADLASLVLGYLEEKES